MKTELESSTNPNRVSWINKVRLLLHGWHPGRSVSVSTDNLGSVVIHTTAENVLKEFSGLQFGDRNCELVEIGLPRKDVASILHATARFSALIERELFPIALVTHQDDETLMIDESGEIYTLSLEFLEDGMMSANLSPLVPSFNGLLTAYLLPLPRAVNTNRLTRHMKQCTLYGQTWKLEPWDPKSVLETD